EKIQLGCASKERTQERDRPPTGPQRGRKTGQNRTKPRTRRQPIDESSNSRFRVQLRAGWQRGNRKLSAPWGNTNAGEQAMSIACETMKEASVSRVTWNQDVLVLTHSDFGRFPCSTSGSTSTPSTSPSACSARPGKSSSAPACAASMRCCASSKGCL